MQIVRLRCLPSKDRLRRAAPLGLTHAVALLVAVLIAGCSGASRLPETEQAGNQIVKALGQYSADHGRYPLSLSDLSPKYLSDIPSPTWGLQEWRYSSDRPDRFGLQVDESTRTGDGNAKWFRYLGPKYGWQLGD